MANTVMNPSIPYVGSIPGGLQDGTTIVVSGTPEHHHNGFSIFLQAGPGIDPRSDCAFAFNPRFGDNCVVRNTLQMGSWGSEERHGGFPFHRGQPVEIIILVKAHHYKVSVNGRHFTDYNHRMPKHRVSHITLEQGFRCNYIRFEGPGVPFGHHGGLGEAIGRGIGGFVGGVLSGFDKHEKHHHHQHQHQGFGSHNVQVTVSQFPSPPPAASYPAPGGAAPIYNPPVPFCQAIPGGTYPGKMIFVSGIPHPGASRFTLNLCCGRDIAFHFDVRMNVGSDRNVIVRNAQQNGSWGPEDRHAPYFPFNRDQYFDMIILVENACYKDPDNDLSLGGFESHKSVRTPQASYGLDAGLFSIVLEFSVYLQSGPQYEPYDIGLVVDARFNYGNDRNVVVRNFKQSNGWGEEEKGIAYFPFVQNANFDMIIMVENHAFKVAVNNQHLLEFYHRIQPISRVDTLRIEGDVRLTQVRFQ